MNLIITHTSVLAREFVAALYKVLPLRLLSWQCCLLRIISVAMETNIETDSSYDSHCCVKRSKVKMHHGYSNMLMKLMFLMSI